jgi:hypothetical protein
VATYFSNLSNPKTRWYDPASFPIRSIGGGKPQALNKYDLDKVQICVSVIGYLESTMIQINAAHLAATDPPEGQSAHLRCDLLPGGLDA